MLNRRALLSAALAAPAVLMASGRIALAAGAVQVDVSRLTTQGLGPNAARIKLAMERELAGALGPSLQGRGASLVVRVLGISMPSYSGGATGFGGAGADDGMESEATVIGPDGRVIATYPVLSSSSAGMAGNWYTPGIDTARIDSMVRTNAGWIRRYVGG